MKFLAGILSSLLLAVSPVQSADFNFNPETLTLTISGDIVAGDSDIYRNISYYTDIDNVLLINSDGGVFDEALDIAIDIMVSGITTGAAGNCFSACAYIWLAGETRFIYDSNTALAIHAPYRPNGERLNERIISKYVWYMDQVGVNPILSRIIFETGPDDLVSLNPLNVSGVAYIVE